MRFGIAWLMLGCLVCACDPLPPPFRPPGGYATRPDRTGEAAIRAVLVTPSHGMFHTVREALSSYMGSGSQEIKIAGWTAKPSPLGSEVPFYVVAFAWNDGERNRTAEWEINEWGIWPQNNEARLLSVYPPEDER